MSTPIPPASDRPNERPALGDAMQPAALDVPDSGQPDPTMAPHQRKGLKAAFKSTWKPLLLGFGIGAVLLGSGAGVAGYVWHQNDVEADRATAKKFAAEKTEAVKSARDEGVTQGTQDGYAQYKQEAEQQAAAAKQEAEKPYTDAKLELEIAQTICLETKADKKGVTVTDHSVTFESAGISKGASIDVVGCMLGGIGMDQATLDKINQTRALDGRQEDTWGVWEASWGYHPDDGLNLVVEIQDAPAN
ncbi:hypothetical protein [Galactobacter sp.]|uniref:hypothetical protein n=1 Tax=Galactobacter sp. TaxID=2676125 RepID=UPI0025C174D0|nr:hypothetical protein [Galactobacter sp.]